MLDLLWLHLLLVLGGLLGGAGLLLVIHDPRRRTHTFWWVILIILAPYIGLPLYLLMGMKRVDKTLMAKGRLDLAAFESDPIEVTGVAHSLTKLLDGLGMPTARGGHSFELLPDGIATWNRLEQLVTSAASTIELETYVFHMDDTGARLRDALAKKAREGVKVRLLIDSLGSHSTHKKFMAPLVEAGGEVAWFIPLLHSPRRGSGDTRNHRKIAIVDRTHVLAGGSNIGSEYIGPTEVPDRWVDINFYLQGPAVRTYFDIFRSDWSFATKTILEGGPDPVMSSAGDSTVQVLPSGVDVPGDVLYNAVVSAIYEARQRLWITTPYFVPDDAIMHALALAARRGIDLRVIVPDVSNQKLADIARGPATREIEQWGGRVVRYTGGMFHAKTIVVDDDWALVGSMNTDRRSLFLNFEVMLAVYSKADIQAIADWNHRLLDTSAEGARQVGRGRLALEPIVRLFAPEL
ncbi:MAG: phospholipase D-like domain-containing protein [Phycisphaerales bacterium]|nr:phospholipase D-like domain-containing protein [Phycisphaerales bacterium]